MDDTQRQAIEALKLCEHGNYHCMICEVKLLKLVIAEQSEEIKQKDAKIKQLREALENIVNTPENYSESYSNAYPTCVRKALATLSQIEKEGSL